MPEAQQQVFHATTVRLLDKGVLITGPSGSGKSSLAISLMAFGAELVSDDRTVLTKADGYLLATAPETIKGMIEARGIGILQARAAGPTPLHLVVDLSREADARLPDPETFEVLGHSLPCLRRVDGSHFAAAILLYLKGGFTSGA